MSNYIACGFYTSDYAPWWEQLRKGLDEHACPHDFVEVKPAESWEMTTMLKAGEIQKAMQRHPQKVVIYLDVDCMVTGSLEPLAALPGDVSVYMRARVHRKTGLRNGSYRMHAIARTIVFNPTAGAREFVSNWIAEPYEYGDVDQTTFLTAMAKSHNTSFQPLAWKWSATLKEPGIITHDNASKGTKKVSQIGRFFARIGA